MAFPFDNPPKELRGLSLNVTFWVQNDGRVERYRVEPEIKDRDYAKKFDEVMRAFRFTPARAPDGTSIPGTTTISFTARSPLRSSRSGRHPFGWARDPGLSSSTRIA
jgi:hypothetical protein